MTPIAKTQPNLKDWLDVILVLECVWQERYVGGGVHSPLHVLRSTNAPEDEAKRDE